MRAALYRETGPASQVLRVEDVDPPAPGPGEVRVRVAVSAVNPTDIKARGGAVPRPIRGFQIPHQDGAGVIDAVGPNVDASRIGQRVWVLLAAVGRFGTAAQWSVVPADHAVALPDTSSYDLGASLGVPAVTAAHCLLAEGPVAGQTVLVSGGAGAVGHYAIELGKHLGAHVVTTVSSEEKAALARAAGADLVVNYRDDDALDQIRSFVSTVDRVVEVNIGANLGLDLALAGPGTTIVSYAATGDDPTLPVRACMSANVVLRFVMLYGVAPAQLGDAVEAVSDALAAGALSELPLHRFGLDEVAAAHEAQESGVVGKVLIDVARP